jgi:DNA-binding NtrC family response regulator
MKNQPRVLVIAEEKTVGDYLKLALERAVEGCQVLSTADNFLVLDHLYREPFNLVILDYDIANMDGLDLSWMIRTIYPSIPIVLISDWSPTRFGRIASPEEFDGFLQKPFSLAQLFNVVTPLMSNGRGNHC